MFWQCFLDQTLFYHKQKEKELHAGTYRQYLFNDLHKFEIDQTDDPVVILTWETYG